MVPFPTAFAPVARPLSSAALRANMLATASYNEVA
jgi:hypothetical protein